MISVHRPHRMHVWGMHAIKHQEIQDFDFKIPRHASTFLRPRLFRLVASVVLVPLGIIFRIPLLLIGRSDWWWQMCLASPTLREGRARIDASLSPEMLCVLACSPRVAACAPAPDTR